MFLFVESQIYCVQMVFRYSRSTPEHFQITLFRTFSEVITFPRVFRSFPFRWKTDSDILVRAKSDGCRFIRAFSDRLPTCIQMEVKLSEEIQINRLKTFQWLFKACLDIRWF